MSEMKSLEEEIRSFGDLPIGWHFGEGIGAIQSSIDLALQVKSLLFDNGVDNIEVFPAIDGGILISGYFRKKYLEALDVSCRPNGTIEIDHEVDDEVEYTRQGLNLNDVGEYLEKLNWNKKKSYGYYIQDISAYKEKDIPARHFNLQVKLEEGEYQSSPVVVHAETVVPNVVISQDTMQETPNTHLYFGESGPDNYRIIPFSHLRNHQQGITATATSGGWEETAVRA